MGPRGSGAFRIGSGVGALAGVLSGAVYYGKYALVSASISFFPAMVSRTDNTIPNGLGLSLAILLDLSQIIMLRGIELSDGVSKKEKFYIVLLVAAVVVEWVSVFMVLMVPDAGMYFGTGMSIGSLFWSRVGMIMTGDWLGVLGNFVVAFLISFGPELLLSWAERSIGTIAYPLMIFGLLVGRVMDVTTMEEVVPIINLKKIKLF